MVRDILGASIALTGLACADSDNPLIAFGIVILGLAVLFYKREEKKR